MTLEELEEKINSLETKVKNMEVDQTMGEHASLLPAFENHAKNCPDFNGFIMSYPNPSNRNSNQITYIYDTITVQCSCGQPEAIWVLCISDQFKVFFFRQYLETINKKYKINKPKINNITDRIELNEPTN